MDWQTNLSHVLGAYFCDSSTAEGAAELIFVTEDHPEYHHLCLSALESGLRISVEGSSEEKAALVAILRHANLAAGTAEDARGILEEIQAEYVIQYDLALAGITAASIDEAAVLAAIDRLWRIEFRHSTGQAGSKAALMREYLRRSALAGAAVGCPSPALWFDAAAALALPGVETRLLPGHSVLNDGSSYPGPGIDVLEEKVIALSQRMSSRSEYPSTQMRNTCFWYIRWEAVKNHPVLVPLALQNPYEPLIVMYERGGWFRMEHGDYIDLEDTMIGAKRTPPVRADTPLPLDEQTLDRLDEAWNQRSEAGRSHG